MIVCPRCREPNQDDATHCGSCRAYLGWSRAGAAEPGGPPPDPPASRGWTEPPVAPVPPGPAAGAGPTPAQPTYPGWPSGTVPTPPERNPPARHPAPPGWPTGTAAGHPPQQPPVRSGEPLTRPLGGGPVPGGPVPPSGPPGRPAAWPGATGRAPAAPPPGHPAYPPPGPAPQQQGPAPGPGSPPGPEQPAVVPPIGTRRAVNTVQLGRMTPVDPLAPRVPERTIGVSIAPTPASVAPRAPVGPPPERTGSDPASAFEAVQPQEQFGPAPAGHQTAPLAQPAGPAPAGPGGLESGQVRCRVCGHPVGADRRFCRCGASLMPASRAGSAQAAARRLPWYRRIGDLFGGNRDFRRSMRSSNRGLRATYNVGLSIRAKFVRVTLLLGAAGLGLSQLGPWGGDLRGQLQGRIEQVLPHSYVDIPVDVVATDPASRALPGYDVKFAVDGDPGRAWAAPWRPTADAGGPCRRSGGAPALLVTFPQPATVGRLSVRAGLAAGNDERSRQAQPRLLDIQFSDGSCASVELANTPDAQQFPVTTGAATSARIVIADIYPAPDGQGPPLVSLSELTFQRKK